MFENKYNMSTEDNILYAKRNIVDSIYTESRLEGIGVTFPDTNEIYEGRTVAGMSIDDTIKIVNLKHAWQFIFDTVNYPVELKYIKRLNFEIGDKTALNAGVIRTIDVSIGGTEWKPDIPDAHTVKNHIAGILNSDEPSTKKAIDLMLYIMRSQLFMDGNKRTAQILANKLMIENGCGIISIPVDLHKDFFIKLIEYYETNDSENISEFIYNECITGVCIVKEEHSINEKFGSIENTADKIEDALNSGVLDKAEQSKSQER